jgi:hypothetical protein
MLPGGCEVQAEQPSDDLAYPVRFKPLLASAPVRGRPDENIGPPDRTVGL